MPIRPLTRRACLVALATAPVLALAMPSARAQAPADWDKVIAAAKQEGKVVVYSGAAPASTVKPAAMFKEKYGIQVDMLTARGGEIRERTRIETTSGRAIGDILINGISTSLEQSQAGELRPHGELPNANKIKAPYADDGTLIPVNGGTWAILVNTNLVKPSDEPKSWHDLLDPKWKGKILMDNPMAPGGGSATFTVFEDKFGRAMLEKFAQQNIAFSEQFQTGEQRLARGEFAIYFPFIVSNSYNLRGLPVKGILPAEGRTYSYQASGILKNAPHPNAARLFLDFLLSDEVQDTYADIAYMSTTGRVSSKTPDDLKALVNGPLLGFATSQRQAEMAPVFRQLFNAR